MLAKARQFLHLFVANLLYYSGLLSLYSFLRWHILRKNAVCVLSLHRVLTKEEWGRSNSQDAMVLRDVTFIKLLEYLRRRFHILSLESFLSHEITVAGTSKPCCLVTFDDGWRDTYTTAFPSMKKLGVPSTVFITTGMLESRGGFWVERLKGAWRASSSRARIQSLFSTAVHNRDEQNDVEHIIEWLKHMPADQRRTILERLPLPPNCSGPDQPDQMLSWSQVVEMSHDGVSFGAHTVSHPLLSYEDDATLERELVLSKQALEEKLNKPVRTLAYPNGDWDERVRSVAERVGYDCAFTTRPGCYGRGQDPYTIRRISIHEGNVTGINGEFSAAMLSLTLAAWK